MNNFIVLLSGSKGSGKSTTAEALMAKMEDLVYLSIDEIRRTLSSDPKIDIRERNKEAFEIIVTKTTESILDKKNVIIDCGVSRDRDLRLEETAKELKAPLYKFFLKAKYETQLERVKKRDKGRGKESTNIKRFDEIYNHFNTKIPDDYIVLETDKLDTSQVVEAVLKRMVV